MEFTNYDKKIQKKKLKMATVFLKEANDVKKIILKSSLNYWNGNEIKNFEKIRQIF